MKYEVAYGMGTYLADAVENLQKDVKCLHEKGYKLQGGVSITVDSEEVYVVAQAMVKKW